MAPQRHSRPPQPAPVFHTSASAILADEEARWEATRVLFDKIVAEVPPEQATFHNVLLPIEHDQNLRWSATEPNFYKMLAPDPDRRQAGLEAQKLAHRSNLDWSMREDVSRLVDAVFRRGDLDTLDPESQRVLREERRKAIQRQGMALPPSPERDRYRSIAERLSELRIEYHKTVDENTGGVWFTAQELDGVPQKTIDGLERGTGENAGKLKVSLKRPDASTLCAFARNPDTRKRYRIAHENRCNENIPRFQEIMKLRHEAARILGYPNHAARRLEGRMAKTPKTVIKFLEDLQSRISRQAREEANELRALKEADLTALGVPFDGNLYAWDLQFYHRLLVKTKYKMDYERIQEYFPLDKTVSRMLRMFGQLLGLVFVELRDDQERGRASPTGKAEDIFWHESVMLYTVWDDDTQGEFVGYLYLDLHPRLGKVGKARCATIRSGFRYPDGTRCYPATCLVADFSPPTGTQPCLLRYREIVTLFHELGHCMHDLVSRTTYARFHGVSVARDFIEAPSQMLENWCRIPSCLAALSSHFETGEPIPHDMLESCIDANRDKSAMNMIDQLGYAIFDMAIHTHPMHEKEPNYPELYCAVHREVTGVKGFEALGKLSEWNHGYACNAALISGNDAGYYGYLWSEVYSTDMFCSAFKDDPMNKEAGRRYRYKLLEKGGSQDEMLTLEQFLGRKPSSEAFFRSLGWA